MPGEPGGPGTRRQGCDRHARRAVSTTKSEKPGEFGVLPEQIAYLSPLEIGVMSYKTVRGGFAEVSNNVMTVLADDAAFAEDIDAAAARSDLQAAEAQLAGMSPLDEAFIAADANRRWAQARLDAARSG